MRAIRVTDLIEHTLLKPETTPSEIEALCQEAVTHRFCAVCVNPVWVSLAARCLGQTPVRVVTVVGFPLGATLPRVKTIEAIEAIRGGAEELDLVINIGALKAGGTELVREELELVVAAARPFPVKAIIEAPLLTEAEKIRACDLAVAAGAAFVKTATGFGPSGATVADVALMRQAVGQRAGVKAAGGIRDLATARAMVTAGANRLGTSSGVAIAREEEMG